MRMRILILVVCVIASGCVQPPARTGRVVWEASAENGDKPGNGIRLVESSGQLSATYFVLDPNKPRDFSAGRELPTDTVKANPTEVRFVVHLNTNETREIVVRFRGPLSGKSLNAIVRGFRAGNQSSTMTFVRQN